MAYTAKMAKRKKKPSAWAKRLKQLRVDLDLTQREAAERAGVSTRAWVAWENDQRVPGKIGQRLLKQAFPDQFP